MGETSRSLEESQIPNGIGDGSDALLTCPLGIGGWLDTLMSRIGVWDLQKIPWCLGYLEDTLVSGITGGYLGVWDSWNIPFCGGSLEDALVSGIVGGYPGAWDSWNIPLCRGSLNILV